MTIDEYMEMCDMFCGGSITGGGFTPGEASQTDGCIVTKNDTKHGGEDNV